MPDILFARFKEFDFIRKVDEQNCLQYYPIDSIVIPDKRLSPIEYLLYSYKLNPRENHR